MRRPHLARVGARRAKSPDLHAGGENSAELVELANSYIGRGLVRRAAYARARAELKQPFKTVARRKLRGGSVSPR